MSAVVKVKKGDTGFRLRFRVYENVELRTPMDLTGKTVKLYAGKGGVLKIDGAACTAEDQEAAETIGFAYYDLVAGDVDTVATYDGEIKVLVAGAPVAIPRQGFFKLIVSRSLA